MALPSFLIVGAMKAGTTSMFDDLRTHPGVFGPADKEPGNLCRDDVLTPEGLRAYERLFEHAGGRACFEASTYYTMLPVHKGVAERARRVLGDGLRVVYIVREPVARTVSHHLHALNAGDTPADIDRAVREDPRLIEYSRYAHQIEPWRATLGDERVCVVQFEHYVANRAQTAGLVQAFLGLDPRPDLIDPDRASNASGAKAVHTGLTRRVARSSAYRRLVRPLLPGGLKRRLGGAVMKAARTESAAPSAETVERILDATREDVRAIAGLVRTPVPAGGLLWDEGDTRRRYAAVREGEASGGG